MYTIKTKDIAINLFRKHEQVMEVKAYPGLLSIYAMTKIAVDCEDAWALKYIKRHYLSKYPIGMDHPQYNFVSYEAGGNGQAYLLFKGVNDEKADVIRRYAEETLKAPLADNGIMTFLSKPYSNQVWIDVVMCTTPFMLYAGLYFNEQKYIDFGVDQCLKMYELFYNPENGLLHQSQGFMADPKAISPDHWSRGNGWGLVGLMELVQYLPKDHPSYNKIAELFRNHCKAFLPYQTKRGLWGQEITSNLSWEESSGSGLILAAIGVGMRTGLLDEATFRAPFEKGIKGLVDRCIYPDFSTEHSCQGCLCPGEGEEKGTWSAYLQDRIYYKNEPHSFGAIMFAFIEADLNGMKTVEWNK